MQPSVRTASPAGAIALPLALLASAASAGAVLAGWVPPALALACGAILAITIAVGVALPASGVFARPVLGARTSRPEFALTFDDGPDPRWTPPLMELLEARGHRATFFVVGARAARYPALLAEMARRGHEVANHTWSHSLVTVLFPPRRLAESLRRTSDLIESSTGVRPRWFRPPVGLLSPRVPIAAKAAALTLVGWTATARDGVSRTTVDAGYARLEGHVRPGAVLVLHDGASGNREPIAHELLRRVLDRAEAAGLTSVTLSRLCAAGMEHPVPPNARSHPDADGGA